MLEVVSLERCEAVLVDRCSAAASRASIVTRFFICATRGVKRFESRCSSDSSYEFSAEEQQAALKEFAK